MLGFTTTSPTSSFSALDVVEVEIIFLRTISARTVRVIVSSKVSMKNGAHAVEVEIKCVVLVSVV